MADQAQQAEAIRELAGLYRRCSEVTTHRGRHELIFGTHKETLAAQRMREGESEPIDTARRRLLATGFDVPDSWLLVNAVWTVVETRWGKVDEAITGERSVGRLTLDPPDFDGVDRVLSEMDMAAMRLESQPGGGPVRAGNGDEKNGCVSDEPLSKADSPSQFAKQLELSNGRKFTRLFKDGKLTGERIDDKNYRLHLRHLPATDPESPAYEPSK